MYRYLFGLLMFLAVLRQFYYGWINEFYIDPSFHFTFTFFSWIKPLGGAGMYAIFCAMGLLALAIAFGYFYRFACLGFFVLFTYVELLDKTTYLNHYYLVSMLSLLLAFMPLGRKNSGMISQFWLYCLRLQVGLVYFYAGVAKLKWDWLWEAQPLSIWLKANSDFPLLGSYFYLPEVGYLFSWSGAIFDLFVAFALCYRRTRALSFFFLVVFHLSTWKLFNLGVFPFLMIINATLFFPPEWPRKKRATRVVGTEIEVSLPHKFWQLALAVHFLLQLLIPLRHHLYGGDLLWDENGFRFSWNVMLIEKTGLATFIGIDKEGRESYEYPSDYLSKIQVKMMSTQPDMIVQFAHHLAALNSYQKIRVESYVALNGRRSQAFMDPEVNLLELSPFTAAEGVLPRLQSAR